MAMFGACKNKTEEEAQDQPTDIVLMNGFNTWDDIILYDMDPTFYKGNWEVNRDSKYISEGNGSWRIYVDSVGANQPSFKIVASGMKTDITDVVEFGLWVYSEADYEFEIIITAYAGDRIVCAPVQKVVNGANDLKFALNRGVVAAQSGKMVTDYSISFAGIKSETVLYVDNFYAKTTTDALVLKPEIQEVITAISALNAQSDRATIEGVIAKYNALSSEDKLAVANISNLKAAIQTYYLEDLGKWQTADPNTLLYFNKPFGEVQVNSATAGIGAYGYSTEQKHGDEEGSLKVEFTTSSTNWVTLKTTAKTLINEEWIEFYVYNDSDQHKAMCVAWNYEKTTIDNTQLPFYVLRSKEWTKIYCKSAWLTASKNGETGTIQICGLASIDPTSLNYGSGESPKGTVYFSSFIKREFDEETTILKEKEEKLRKDMAEARTGEDENTLYFFDRELGLRQSSVKDSNMQVSLSENVKVNSETATEVSFNNVQDATSILSVISCDYEFNEGDYVAFYAMADVQGADYVSIRLNAPYVDTNDNNKLKDYFVYGTYLHNKKTSLVLLPADKISGEIQLKFIAEIDSETLGGSKYSANTTTNMKGAVYLTKAKVYSASEVKDLATASDTYEFNIGSTTCVGKINALTTNGANQWGEYNYDTKVYASPWDTSYFQVNDTLRFYARSMRREEGKLVSPQNTCIGIELKDAIPANSGKKIYITASGFVNRDDENGVYGTYLQVFAGRETGHKSSPRGTIVEEKDGLITWCFDVSAVASELKYFRLWTGHQLLLPDTELVTITDISIR